MTETTVYPYGAEDNFYPHGFVFDYNRDLKKPQFLPLTFRRSRGREYFIPSSLNSYWKAVEKF